MPGEASGVETDTVYDLLADDRRRRVLRHLQGAGDPVLLGDLAETVAAAEAEGSASDDRVAAVRTALYHVHLPKLADAGVVEFAESPGRVSLGEHADAVLARLGESGGPGAEQ